MTHNDELFDRELSQQLRRVAVPKDLKSILLSIPDTAQTPPEPLVNEAQKAKPPALPLTSRTAGPWIWALAGSLAGLALIAGWWISNKANRQPPAVVQSEQNLNSQSGSRTTPDLDAARQATIDKQLAELSAINRQLKALSLEYEQLQSDQWDRQAIVIDPPSDAQIQAEYEESMALVILNSAETAYQSLGASDSIKEQLEFVAKRFNRTDSATAARRLLSQF